jgi:hypothetical protein
VFQVALEDIIAHPIDLESLLGQYDSRTIFVGPLLSSSESFPYRYFYIAGASSKIYQSINLGLIDSETKAQCRRAAVVEKLENRFTGVLTFGSHREMAYAVHARWPNEETAEILASAALAMTAELTKAAYQHENIDDGRCAGSLPHSEQSVDLGSHGLVDDAGDLDAISTDMAPWALGSLSSNGPAKQKRSKFNEDLAPAVLRLRRSTQLEIVPSLPLEGTRRLPSILRYCVVAVVVVVISAAIGFRTILPVADETKPAPIPVPLISASRHNDPPQVVAAAPQSVLDQNAAPLVSVSRDNDTSQTTVGVPLSVPSRHAEADGQASSAGQAPAAARASSDLLPLQAATGQTGPTLTSEPTLRSVQGNDAARPLGDSLLLTSTNSNPNSSQVATSAVPSDPLRVRPTVPTGPLSLPSHLSQVNSTQTGSAFASAAQSLPAQEESAAKHLDDEEITRLVNLGMTFLKSGDLSAARPLFLRAADAGSANAAFMLGETFDPLVMQRLGVVGIEPDVVRARRWYEKAEELGFNVAARELAKLSAFRD